MFYLVSQILLCLLIAALIGGAIGWWLRSLRCRTELDDQRAALGREHESALGLFTGRVEAAEASAQDLQARLDSVVSEGEQARLQLADAETALADAQQARTAAETATAEAVASREALDRELAALRDQVAAAQAATEKAEQQVAEGESAWLAKLRTAEAAVEQAAHDAAEDRRKAQAESESLGRRIAELVAMQATSAEQHQAERLSLLARVESADQQRQSDAGETDSLRLRLSTCEERVAEAKSAAAAAASREADLRSQLATCEASRQELESSLKAGAASLAAATAGTAALGLLGAKPESPDDLKRVEGIGPKIESLLNDDGIWTFLALSQAPVERLQSVLDAAGPRYRIHDPGTWPEQARLAEAGAWEELEALQDRLKGGREA